jgi:hypothetical protein
MLVFNNYFFKNRKSKLHFGDRVAVLNVFLYQTGGSRICRALWSLEGKITRNKAKRKNAQRRE